MYDVVVIGAGPGGYVAAIRAAQRGMRVACIEKGSTLGGTCLNVGCIPSKALLHSSEYFARIAEGGSEHGIIAAELSVDFARMMERKQSVVKGLTEDIAFLFKKNKVEWIRGHASFLTPNKLRVGDQEVEGRSIIIATGSEPMTLPFLPFDERWIVSSTGALALKTIPKKMLIVGAGVIGLELGSVYRRLGCKIEVVELLDRVIPSFDHDISKAAGQIFKKQGITFHLSTKVTGGRVENNGVTLDLDTRSIRGDVVLVAIGRKPYTAGLGLDKIGLPEGVIAIDGYFETQVPHVYAIGDVVDGPMLAHKASEEAVTLIDYLASDKRSLNYLAIPNVMYTWPEVAAVGMTEEEAKKQQLDVCTGSSPFTANPRARCSGDAVGIVKIVAEKKSQKILGLHIIGPSASEMIGEGVLAIERGMTLAQLAHLPHAHPTCCEAIKEAALAALAAAGSKIFDR